MRDTDDLQRADEGEKIARCVVLYKKAIFREEFTPEELADLRYFLGLNDYFKEKA